MKIVIAAWHLEDYNVGLGRYCRELIEALGRVDQENRYDILMPNRSYPFPERRNFRYRMVRFPVFKRRFWEQTAPLVAGPCDVLHFPYDSVVAWKRGAFVATVHDVKPLIFPELRPRKNLNSVIEGLLVGKRWEKIDHVITDSESSLRDIVEKTGVSRHRITVVYPGVQSDRFRPPSVENGDPSTATSRPYVFTVAGSDPTKNLETLVDAFVRLPPAIRDAHDLVIAGDLNRRSDLRERAARAGLEKQTFFVGRVTDERLVELYQRATLFLFPSRYEGFGLPVLEAMASGCPVICSNASSLPEVAGDAGILEDPTDTDGFARSMERVLTNPDVHQTLRQRGLEQAARFSWDRTARETVAVYEKVTAQRKG